MKGGCVFLEKHKEPDCKCHSRDFDLDFRNCSYWPCCSSRCECRCEYGCNCCRKHCRRKLCDDDFSIRLAGLTDGLNYRLYQLLWFNVKIELENGQSVFGEIIYVGSNFVELLLPLVDGEAVEEDMEEESEDLTQEDFAAKTEHRENREHMKGRTLIFSIDRIVSVESTNTRTE